MTHVVQEEGFGLPQPHKGDRVPTMVRPPRPLRLTLEAAAAAAGYRHLNDYLVDLLEAAHSGQPLPVPQAYRQEKSPLPDKSEAA